MKDEKQEEDKEVCEHCGREDCDGDPETCGDWSKGF